jgi:serine/threonine protein kinase/WD40 repeat protein
MNSSPKKCPRCGTPKSAALGGNCPNCLVALGVPDPPADPECERPSGSLPRLGDYELLEEIARGGMGVVYRARQSSLNRTVAVKVLLGGQFSNQAFIKRFRREAEAAASLNHPNIVAIYEVGEHLAQPYFSMELVEGRSLSELSRDQPLPARQTAQWLKTIAEAVHFAHQRGVLHRDLKPSNVLMDTHGAPHITDFGLAKFAAQTSAPPRSGAVSPARPGSGSERGRPENPQSASPAPHDLTLTGQVLGSPNYMPPEQADPKRGPTTVASDVYSLGAILYHLLTGRPPFMAETLTETLRLVGEGELVSPRLLNPNLSRDLETICRKCLEPAPENRYASAQELAEELGRFLRDEPIRARPVGFIGQLLRWCRRKPALASAVGAGLFLLLVVLVGLPIATYRIQRARATAEAARQQEAALRARAEFAERATEFQLYNALLEQARATVRSGELGQRLRTLDAVQRAAAISNTTELRREALAGLALPDLHFDRELMTGPDCTLAALDPTFARVAISHGTNAVEIRSVTNQALLMTLPASLAAPTRAGGWSKDGRFLGIARRESIRDAPIRVEIWDTFAGRQRLVLPPTAHGAFAFHPRLPLVLGDTGSNSIATWNLETGDVIALVGVTGLVHHLLYSPDGQEFLAQHGSEKLWLTSLYDAESGAVRNSKLSGWTDDIAWHPQDCWIAFATRNGEIHLEDRRTGETSVLGRHKDRALTALFSADGDFLFTGGQEQEILCWDLHLGEQAFAVRLGSAQLQCHTREPRCAVLTSTGLRLYTLQRPTTHRDLAGNLGGGLRHAAFSPDGRWLAAGGGAALGLWDWKFDVPAVVPFQAEHPIPVFAPNSSELFSFWSEELARWRIEPQDATTASPPRLTRLEVPGIDRVYSATFVGDQLILGTAAGPLIFPDANLTAPALRPEKSGQTTGVVSPDGQTLAISKGWWMQLFQLEPWNGRGLVDMGARILSHKFTARSDELAVATATGITFLETNRWTARRTLPVVLDENMQMIFTPDGHGLWLARDARNAALHELATFETLLPLPSGVTPLALDADGRHLAVSLDSRRVQVWDLTEIRRRLRELGLGWRERP